MERAGHLLNKLGGSERRKTKKRVGGNMRNAQGEAIQEENDSADDDENEEHIDGTVVPSKDKSHRLIHHDDSDSNASVNMNEDEVGRDSKMRRS